MIRAILWDLDGVIVDSEEMTRHRWIKTYKELGYIVPYEIFYQTMGLRTHEAYDLINTECELELDLTFDEFFAIHKKNRGKRPDVPLVPHVKEVLKKLHEKYLLAVVTSANKKWMHEMLKPQGLEQYFRVMVASESIKNAKPHPEPYLNALKKLGITPSEAAVIEDSPHGITSGKKAGAIIIARKADHNKTQTFTKADFVIKDLREIPKIINKINKSQL